MHIFDLTVRSLSVLLLQNQIISFIISGMDNRCKRSPSPEGSPETSSFSDDLTDAEGQANIDLNQLSETEIKGLCKAKGIDDTGNREQNIELLRLKAKEEMAQKTLIPHTRDESEEEESAYGGEFVNVFVAVNGSGPKPIIADSNSSEDSPRHALPLSPEVHSSEPIIDWLSPKASAAAIRRECASRIPRIQIPARMLAKEVKDIYGPMLMELQKERWLAKRDLGDEGSEMEENSGDEEAEMETDEEY